MKNANYSEITESTGQRATREQLERLYQRYRFASTQITGGAILEVGCGSGMGLAYLKRYASRVTGGDIDMQNIEAATQKHRGNREITVVHMDAHDLPFDDESFDTILLLETIYYLENPEQSVSEAHRTLSKKGKLIVCTVNKSWKDFHPSKYSRKYFSVPELDALLRNKFANREFYAAFEVEDATISTKMYSLVKRTASKLSLIPGSLKARELLKRLFIGELQPIPAEVSDGITEYREPVPLRKDCPTGRYKILYVVASK